ncbi:hypothetical protein [Corynebacterium senegalense]|uniref:hypothetical protein n=1 Tax=Corynebacterium senegalense TaxID=2080750 RepID=UPI000E20877F|nr:hypothetical protein [Corynebacterium senegalense]
MKRTRTTVLAASLAGVLALAAPAAIAPAAGAADLPAETTAATGEEYFLNQEGTHYVPSADAVATPFAELDSATREKSVPVDAAEAAGLKGVSGADAAAESPAKEVTPAGDGAPAERPFSKDDVSADSEHPVAAGLIALPSVLSIDGSTYYLNADGETYVTDMERIGAEPTEQERAASNDLLSRNSAEVGRQAIAEAKAGGAAAPAPAAGVQVSNTAQDAPAPAEATTAPAADTSAEARGMAAQTGSNTAARALAALLVASVIGAAAFAFGRRRLI